jgi:hypothetical protein
MRRIVVMFACLLLALALVPATAAAKKHKKRGLGPVITVTATGNTVTAPGQESIATATCPPRLFAVGGGFSAPITATSSMVVHDSYRSSAQAWTVAGRAFTGTSAATAYAYCRRAAKNPVSDQTGTAPIAASGAPGSATATCPTGRLIGGGFQSTVGPGNPQVALVEVNASTSSSTWTATAVANGSGPQTLTAHAYCMSGIRAPVLVSASSSGNVALRESVTATTPGCPISKKKGKKRKTRPPRKLSAGGYSSTIGTATGPVGVLSDSRLGPPGWVATDVNGTSPGTISVTSQGICF